MSKLKNVLNIEVEWNTQLFS